MATFTLIPARPENNAQTQLLTQVDLSADSSTSTFTYVSGSKLVLINNEAADISVNILGDGQTSFNCPEYGSLDVSGGINITVTNDGVAKEVDLNRIKAYLGATGNTVTVVTTGAAGASFGWLKAGN